MERDLKVVKVALYLRVSTNEQHSENQLPELENYVKARGWSIEKVYIDHGISGRKASRPKLDQLLIDGRKRQFDAVVCWSISRFGRSMVNSVLAMHELTEMGIRLVALQQAVDTGTVIGRGVAALLSALAEAEVEEKRDRVKAGIRRARAKGKRWGAPKKHLVPVDEVKTRLAEGESLGRIAADLGIPKTTVYRQLQQSQA